MKTFKQHLNALEKQRKSEKNTSPNDGVMPVYVHGKHARPTNDGVMPVYVHGKHASSKINENENRVYDTEFEPLDDLNNASKRARRREPKETSPKFDDWANDYNKSVDINSLDSELREHYSDHLKMHDSYQHLRGYTSGSTSINRALIADHREGKTDMNGDRGHIERRDAIDKVLSSKELPKDIDTFSGLGFDPRNHMDENSVLHSPAFLSSSINPRTASGFGTTLHPETGKQVDYDDYDTAPVQHILRIPVKAGSKAGTYVNGISKFGYSEAYGDSGEQEFLHARGQKFKIDPTPQVLKGWGKTSMYVWNATPHED
jgi:hypothetical protein